MDLWSLSSCLNYYYFVYGRHSLLDVPPSCYAASSYHYSDGPNWTEQAQFDGSDVTCRPQYLNISVFASTITSMMISLSPKTFTAMYAAWQNVPGILRWHWCQGWRDHLGLVGQLIEWTLDTFLHPQNPTTRLESFGTWSWWSQLERIQNIASA